MVVDEQLVFTHRQVRYSIRDVVVSDINATYLAALRQGSPFISGIPKQVTRESQAEYVSSISESAQNWFFGLFADGDLIATSGIQVRGVDSFLTASAAATYAEPRVATVGIFIFDQRYRGKGLGSVLVWSAVALHNHAKVTSLYGAGMHVRNTPSLRSFLVVGFVIVETAGDYHRVMAPASEVTKPHSVQLEQP